MAKPGVKRGNLAFQGGATSGPLWSMEEMIERAAAQLESNVCGFFVYGFK